MKCVVWRLTAVHTYLCSQHRGGGTFSRKLRTLSTPRQLEVSSGKWDTLNTLTNSWSQVHPGAPTPGSAINLGGKSRSGTGSRRQHDGPFLCLQDHHHCSPFSLLSASDPQRGEADRGAKTQRMREEEEEEGGGRQPWQEKAPKFYN